MGICGQCGELKSKRNDKNNKGSFNGNYFIDCEIQKNKNEICFKIPIVEDSSSEYNIQKVEENKEKSKTETIEEKKSEKVEDSSSEYNIQKVEENKEELKTDTIEEKKIVKEKIFEEKIFEEKNKNQEIKDEINKRQYDLRKGKIPSYKKKNDNIDLIEKIGKETCLLDEEIKKQENKARLLEDMSKMGTITKEEIISKKKKNPENFFSEQEIIQNKSDEQIYALGIFSKVLENLGMTTAIEKNSCNEDSTNTAQTTMQFLVNGMADRSKFDLHFDFGEEKNSKLLNDETERRKFHDKLRKKISKEYNIKEEDIIITFPRRGSYLVTLIFKSEDFRLDADELLKKFQNEKDELGKLKSIEKGIILGGCYLTKNMLDPKGNNRDGGWAGKGEKRGNEEYIPPTGWIGYGLKVSDVYENNIWLGMNNTDGEWCVAYHGVARNQEPEEVARITGVIYKSGFIPSKEGKITDDPDLRHPGKNCGLGVYCSPDINYAESYAGITTFNGENYKCVLMLRINPKKIRQSTKYPKEYILEPTTDEIRPYRILLKKC